MIPQFASVLLTGTVPNAQLLTVAALLLLAGVAFFFISGLIDIAFYLCVFGGLAVFVFAVAATIPLPTNVTFLVGLFVIGGVIIYAIA